MFPIGAWRNACNFFEGLLEIADGGITTIFADITNGIGGGSQHLLRLFHSDFKQIFGNGFAHMLLKISAQIFSG